jgi:hypothetical protein
MIPPYLHKHHHYQPSLSITWSTSLPFPFHHFLHNFIDSVDFTNFNNLPLPVYRQYCPLRDVNHFIISCLILSALQITFTHHFLQFYGRYDHFYSIQHFTIFCLILSMIRFKPLTLALSGLQIY